MDLRLMNASTVTYILEIPLITQKDNAIFLATLMNLDDTFVDCIVLSIPCKIHHNPSMNGSIPTTMKQENSTSIPLPGWESRHSRR